MDKAEFGRLLFRHRRRAGLTQDQLADAMDVAKQTVKDWENGRKLPYLDRLPHLAAILKVDPGALFPSVPACGPREERRSLLTIEERLSRIERTMDLVLAELRQMQGR